MNAKLALRRYIPLAERTKAIVLSKRGKKWQAIVTVAHAEITCIAHITLKFAGFSEIAVIMDSSPSKTNAGPDILSNNS